MTVITMDQIKFKRGLFKNLPKKLESGEPAYCIDTGELFIGNDKGEPELVVTPHITLDGGRFDVPDGELNETDILILEGGYF